MVWSQGYDPLGNLALSALVASLPVVLLLALLALFHVRAHWAAVAGLLAAMGIAISVFQMPLELATAIWGAVWIVSDRLDRYRGYFCVRDHRGNGTV
jgi:lactate permease